MARLASQIKMGFYPTPDKVIEQIRELIEFTEGSRCIDTCCGEGEALEMLTKDYPVETYGIELDKERSKRAKSRLNNVLNCDSLYETYITNNSFDLLFLNPPYDWEVKAEESEDAIKTEKKFLQFHLRFLHSKGLLVYIIPFNSLRFTYRLFLRLKDLRVLAFPEDEYKKFKQVVVIGKSSSLSGPSVINANRAMLQNIIKYVDPETAYQSLWTTETILRSDYRPFYIVEKNNVELKNFLSTKVDPEEVFDDVQKSSLYSDFEKQLTVKKVGSIQPLSMLRNGHLAMLLASGVMNGKLENEKYSLIVKGNIESFMEQSIEVDEDDSNDSRREYITETKVYKVQVRVLNLKTLQFMNIE